MKKNHSHIHSTATVLICATDPVFRSHLERLLHDFGWSQCFSVSCGKDALKLALERLPGLVVVAHEPPELNGIELIAAIMEKLWVPVLFSAPFWTTELSKVAVAAGAATFITRFPTSEELSKAICEADSRLEHDEQLRNRLQESERRLEERKVIEKAKGLLMERERICESEAFKRMRSQSMTRRISMAKLAEELITGSVRQGLP